jgi:hypothetical protein
MALGPRRRFWSKVRSTSKLRLLDNAFSTGDAIDLPCHKAGFLGSQQDIDRRDFDGLTWPPHRHIFAEMLDLLLGLPPLGCSAVQKGPGATAFTRTPRSIICFERALVNATIPAFVVA